MKTPKRQDTIAVKENLDRIFNSIYHKIIYLVHPNP